MRDMKTSQRAKRDAMFLKGPVTFGWIKRSIPDPTSRLILWLKLTENGNAGSQLSGTFT